MVGFIGNIGPWELVFILAIALIVVGPGKLPEVAKSMGKAVNEFKKSTSGVKKEFENVMKFDDPQVVKNESLQTILDTKTEVVNSTGGTESKMGENSDSTGDPVN
jgi:Tat protein translocase TatB subunit